VRNQRIQEQRKLHAGDKFFKKKGPSKSKDFETLIPDTENAEPAVLGVVLDRE